MRQCGDCTLCCKLLPVYDGVMVDGKKLGGSLDKKAGERCPHQSHSKGCKVYGTRGMPRCCSMWNCRWLTGEDTADLSRPDRSHLVIDVMPDHIELLNNETAEKVAIEVVQVWCDPRYPDAHRDPQFRRYVERRAAEGKFTLIRFNSRDAITLIAPSFSENGQWQEQGGQSVDRQHNLMQTVEALSKGWTPMHTKDVLAQELRAAGLHEMADRAATGYYHDFLSPLDAPAVALLADLKSAGTPQALALRQRAMNGDFDASDEEGDEWAKSPDGQEAMRSLMAKR